MNSVNVTMKRVLVKSINKPILLNGTPVIVKELGDNEEYKGTIVGVVFRNDEEVLNYLVELDKSNTLPGYEYKVVSITPACVFYYEEELQVTYEQVVDFLNGSYGTYEGLRVGVDYFKRVNREIEEKYGHDVFFLQRLISTLCDSGVSVNKL